MNQTAEPTPNKTQHLTLTQSASAQVLTKQPEQKAKAVNSMLDGKSLVSAVVTSSQTHAQTQNVLPARASVPAIQIAANNTNGTSNINTKQQQQQQTAKPRKRKAKGLAQQISSEQLATAETSSPQNSSTVNLNISKQPVLVDSESLKGVQGACRKTTNELKGEKVVLDSCIEIVSIINQATLVAAEKSKVLKQKPLEVPKVVQQKPEVVKEMQKQQVSNNEKIKQTIAKSVVELPQQTKSYGETRETSAKNNNDKQIDYTKKSPVVEAKTAETVLAKPSSPKPTLNHILKLTSQSKSEDTDDIDAGIELDGSSNSGSSVKDMGEEHASKLASVSPIDSPFLDNAIKSRKQLSNEGSKKLSTKKQQLAANLQDIDADEQQLQMKLLKQLSSGIGGTGCSEDIKSTIVKSPQKPKPRVDLPNRVQKKILSQKSQDSQDSSLCKVCGSHVYQMERMLAEKSVYHKKCFRCHQCKTQLRVDNYASHAGEVYCKAHHKQIFQPQVKLDKDSDVDIVTKSRTRKRQMIICENEPAELPKDIVRCNEKMEDGIKQLNLNLGNIKEKFEMASQQQSSPQSSPSVIIDKPSFNIKKTLMAFESKLNESQQQPQNASIQHSQVAIGLSIRELANGFLNRGSSFEENFNKSKQATETKSVQRSESLMMRLRKYESRIAGSSVDDDDDDNDDDEANCYDNENELETTSDLSHSDSDHSFLAKNSKKLKSRTADKKRDISANKTKLCINLSSLKSQWENGDIINRRSNDDEETDTNTNVNNVKEQDEELYRIRQSLAQKKHSESASIKNIYEKAIENQQQYNSSKREQDPILNEIAKNAFKQSRQEFLQQNTTTFINNKSRQYTDNESYGNSNNKSVTLKQNLNFNINTNKLKERFELGLASNANSFDDSETSDSEEKPLSKLDKIRQEKLDDLSVFTEGEIKAREARSLFQQIDKKISAANGCNDRIFNSK